MLRLLHLYTPFVTEALWSYLKEACINAGLPAISPSGWEEALIVAKWPERYVLDGWDEEFIKDFSLIQEIVRGIRNIRSEYKIAPARKLEAVLVSENLQILLESQKLVLCDLAGLEEEETRIYTRKPDDLEGMVSLVVNEVEVFLNIAGGGDDEAERARLEKELQELENQIARLEALLAGPFAQKAPAKIVDAEREKLEGYRVSAQKIREQLSQ
jgi:valyl-tRNA synthetase